MLHPAKGRTWVHASDDDWRGGTCMCTATLTRCLPPSRASRKQAARYERMAQAVQEAGEALGYLAEVTEEATAAFTALVPATPVAPPVD